MDNGRACLEPAHVLLAILELETSGASLKSCRIREANTHLAEAGIRHFGSWGNALKAAGIDAEKIAKRRKWTTTRVIKAIHALHRQGVSLHYASVRDADGGLPQAARKLLGSWNNALRAAGYDPDRVRISRRPWTREDIMELIRTRYATGLPIATYSVEPLSAEVAARRLFGSWRAAIRAAGVPCPMTALPVWSKVSVMESILRKLQAGEPLWCGAVAQQEPRLYDAARRYFGSWRRALREAGIDPEVVRRKHRKYVKDDIVAHLRESNREHRNRCRTFQHPESIVKAARRLFGSWQEALRAAGVAADGGTKEDLLARPAETRPRGERRMGAAPCTPCRTRSKDDPPATVGPSAGTIT